MSDTTFVAIQGKTALFTPQYVTGILLAIPGIQKVHPRKDYTGKESVEAEYCWQGESTDVWLLAGYNCLSIHGSGDISLAFALEFAKRHSEVSDAALELFNELYDFHQLLSADLDLVTLNQRINEEPFAGRSDYDQAE